MKGVLILTVLGVGLCIISLQNVKATNSNENENSNSNKEDTKGQVPDEPAVFFAEDDFSYEFASGHETVSMSESTGRLKRAQCCTDGRICPGSSFCCRKGSSLNAYCCPRGKACCKTGSTWGCCWIA